MKKLLVILLILFPHFVEGFSQRITDTLTHDLDQSMQNEPADQVFLHLDRNLYHPGDTIRFQAYIRDRNSGIFGSESISLFTLLLNKAHETVDSARFRIMNFGASGWLKIPQTIPLGNYSVLAYTSMMMNYDPEFVFSIPIRIEEQRNAQLTKNQIVEETVSPFFQESSTKSKIDLRFLPEGGTFICNVLQRMAFNAVTSSGRILKVKGEIRNQRGKKVTEFISGEYGPGLIELRAIQGDTLFAFLNGKEFSGMKWPLPVPERSGIAMRVNNSQNGMIEVSLEGKGVASKTWLLAITMNNNLILSREVRSDSLFRLNLNTDELPAGTAYVTIYDNELNPVAERLIFINNDKKMTIHISSSSPVVKNGNETELILNTTDDDGENISSMVSIAVIDSLSGFCSTLPFPDIESKLLYDRHFYDNLPPVTKLRGLNNLDKNTIDLLLMTYGWRKFCQRNNPESGSKKEILDYDYLKIKDLEPGKEDKMSVPILTLEDANILKLPVNKVKEAILSFNSLNDSVRRIRILTDNKSTKNMISAKIEFPENKSFSDKAKQVHNEAFNNSSSLSDTTLNMKTLFPFPDSVINIEEVIIKPKRIPAPPHAYVNKYEQLYQSTGIITKTYSDFKAWPSFEYILGLFNPSNLDPNKKQVYLSLRSPFPALFVLDDIPIGKSYEIIDMLPTSEIESVSVLKGTRGFTIYGTAANGGVVFVTTKKGFEEAKPEKNDELLRPVRLFRTEIEFYMPPKEEVDSKTALQPRPTILWMNEVMLDGSGPVKIQYPDKITKGTALVFVNGISSANNVGSGSFRYIIK
jgi:hypothetical protein